MCLYNIFYVAYFAFGIIFIFVASFILLRLNVYNMMPVSVKYGEKYHCVINPDVSRGYKIYGMMSKNDGNFTTFVNKKSSFGLIL